MNELLYIDKVALPGFEPVTAAPENDGIRL